jgi:hypothetical protein
MYYRSKYVITDQITAFSACFQPFCVNERDHFQQTKKQLFAQLHISANHDELYIFIRQSYFYEKKQMFFCDKYKHFREKRD